MLRKWNRPWLGGVCSRCRVGHVPFHGRSDGTVWRYGEADGTWREPWDMDRGGGLVRYPGQMAVYNGQGFDN